MNYMNKIKILMIKKNKKNYMINGMMKLKKKLMKYLNNKKKKKNKNMNKNILTDNIIYNIKNINNLCFYKNISMNKKVKVFKNKT